MRACGCSPHRASTRPRWATSRRQPASQPRRGALYKHLPSKQALLETAVRRHLERSATGASQLDDVDLAGALGADPALLRLFVHGLGRWFLDEMDRMEGLTRILEQDGGRLPATVADVKHQIVDLSYRAATHLVEVGAPNTPDAEATAVILLGSLVALRRTAWTFGTPALDLADTRALAAWTDITLMTLGVMP